MKLFMYGLNLTSIKFDSLGVNTWPYDFLRIPVVDSNVWPRLITTDVD